MEEEKYTQLCVWPGTIVGEGKEEEFIAFFKEQFNARVKFAEEIKTQPDTDNNGKPVPNTGGRNDAFFYVHQDDIGHFAVPRLKMGIRWWEDVLGNGAAHLYSKEILNKYNPTWNEKTIAKANR